MPCDDAVNRIRKMTSMILLIFDLSSHYSLRWVNRRVCQGVGIRTFPSVSVARGGSSWTKMTTIHTTGLIMMNNLSAAFNLSPTSLFVCLFVCFKYGEGCAKADNDDNDPHHRSDYDEQPFCSF